jgi:hypothetical protein
MLRLLRLTLVAGLGVLAFSGIANADPVNANVTTYTATCAGLPGLADATRVELSLDASPNSGAGVAFHVLGTTQIVLLADNPGLTRRAEAAGTSCTVTAINGQAIPPFVAPIVVV